MISGENKGSESINVDNEYKHDKLTKHVVYRPRAHALNKSINLIKNICGAPNSGVNYDGINSNNGNNGDTWNNINGSDGINNINPTISSLLKCG